MASSTSNPLAGLDLIGTNEVARILEIHPANVTMRMHRGTFAIEPAIVVADGRRFWHRADVLRAKELLSAKPETPHTQQEAQS
jgi:hypothetical protein